MIVITTKLQTKSGIFNFSVIKSRKNETVFLTTKNLDPSKEVYVRIHSECMTGDIFHSLKCDCGEQLNKSLKMLNKSKNGVLIYLRQEGRGIGLFNKIKTYNIQDSGIDTHQANIKINRKPDEREYSQAIKILEFLKIKKINLITNNPNKVRAIRKSNLSLNKVVLIKIRPNRFNKKYIETKRKKFKHYSRKRNIKIYLGISGISTKQELSLIENMIEPIEDKNIFLGITSREENFKKSFRLALSPPKKGFKKIIHFSFSKKITRDWVKRLAKYRGLGGLQLNGIYKEKNILESRELIKSIGIIPNRLEIIFPITAENLEILKNEYFLKIIKNKKVHFLIDDSHGRGLKSNSRTYLNYIFSLLDKGQNQIGIAGGIGPNNNKIISELEDYFKFEFSVDAESKLRSNGKLDITKIKNYIKALK